uniref:ribose-phosphate diphosphokinase n=1 Tax=Chromera velia CCMP2878 TaxID=1169474 RepID=A0A0G4F2X9_9ALVE|eukprot:Cvel_14724.t1-p1 / transcript=Cvel_14724.t1 / gene=Cvel_14724 / organism=Chromera_velia_CCMP2878 / gene_product=Ribose-phosphate pyrophosphokinase, putative / transcript_product=Ribose-phosphate pyrophosphokinase, putative / location=Cvel_scaffold1058:43657-56602(+) / protein_length=494 / sequence_SO=supercontig / SO=protein_coding / is_pseudo=false
MSLEALLKVAPGGLLFAVLGVSLFSPSPSFSFSLSDSFSRLRLQANTFLIQSACWKDSDQPKEECGKRGEETGVSISSSLLALPGFTKLLSIGRQQTFVALAEEHEEMRRDAVDPIGSKKSSEIITGRFLHAQEADRPDFKIFAGSGNPELAREISTVLGTELGRVRVGRFLDGETSIKILDRVEGADVFVVQSAPSPSGFSGDPDSSVIELLLLVAALARAAAGSITVVVPYLSYTRHTVSDDLKRPIAAADIAQMLAAVGCDRVVCMDIHNRRMEGFFPPDIPVTHVDPHVLAVHFFAKMGLNDPVVVPADSNGAERGISFWNRMRRIGIDVGWASVVSNRKQRPARGDVGVSLDDVAKGEEREVEGRSRDSVWLVGDVKGRDVIIVDDLIDSGNTVEDVATMCRKAGAGRILVYASHGVFSKGAVERIERSPIDEVIVTNSITIPPHIFSEKLRVISIAKMLAETIDRLHDNRSVSELYRETYYEQFEKTE